MNGTARQLLVVLPDGRYVPDDEHLEQLLYDLAEAKPPSKTHRVVAGTLNFVFRVKLESQLHNLARDLRKLNKGELGDDALTDSAKEFRGAYVRSIMHVLKPLLKSLLAVNSDRALPDLRVYSEGEPRLAELSSADGRFLTNVVYSAHPGDQNFFVRLADYHSFLLNEKRGEFLRLAGALGAKSIRLAETDAREQKATATFAAGDGSAKFESKLKMRDRTDSMFTLASEFDRPGTRVRPHVPDRLRWIQLEPLWSAMAQVRLANWQLKHRVVFDYSNDFSVDAKLAARVGTLGLSCGGSFHGAHSVRQEYEVEFFSRSEYPGLDG
jgi:hypothetical protein